MRCHLMVWAGSSSSVASASAMDCLRIQTLSRLSLPCVEHTETMYSGLAGDKPTAMPSHGLGRAQVSTASNLLAKDFKTSECHRSHPHRVLNSPIACSDIAVNKAALISSPVVGETPTQSQARLPILDEVFEAAESMSNPHMESSEST